MGQKSGELIREQSSAPSRGSVSPKSRKSVGARGGRIVVGFLPKDLMARQNMPAAIFTLHAPEDAISALKKYGFGDIRVERPQPDTPL